MKYLHQSPYTFLVAVNIMLPVDRDRHLPISEYSVLLFIQRLDPFDDLLILNLSVTRRKFQPFVICGSVYI